MLKTPVEYRSKPPAARRADRDLTRPDGIGSVVAFVVAVVLVLVPFAGMAALPGYGYLVLIAACWLGAAVAVVVGTVLGIINLRSPRTRNWLGIIGVVLNGLGLAAMVLIVLHGTGVFGGAPAGHVP